MSSSDRTRLELGVKEPVALLALSLPVSPSRMLVPVCELKSEAPGSPVGGPWAILLLAELLRREDPGPAGEVPRCE